MFVRVNAIFNTRGVILHEGRIGGSQPRPQGHLCGRGEEIDDPGKGCKNLQDSWRFSSMHRQ